MEYNLEGGALPPGSITHPHQKGIRAYAGLSMVQLMVASKWFSNIDSDDYKLFSKFCEGKIGKKIGNTGDVPSIVKSMISIMVNIEDSHFNYNYMGLNHNEGSDFLKDILKRYFDENGTKRLYSLGMENLVLIIRTVLEAVFIFTVYKQVIEHLIPNHNNSSGYGLGKNLSSSFWKLDYVKENMLDRKRFARDSSHAHKNVVGDERASLYCWWYLNDEDAKKWYHEPLPSSLWGNPPMGSILFTINEKSLNLIEKIPTYFFHMMLNTNTNPGNKKAVGEKLHTHSHTKVDSWTFLTISLTPSMIDRMAQSFVSKEDAIFSAKADFLDRLRRLELLETIADPLVKHQWFSSDPLWLNDFFGKGEMVFFDEEPMGWTQYMAGFVKMNDTSNPRMTFINWPYELPFNI